MTKQVVALFLLLASSFGVSAVAQTKTSSTVRDVDWMNRTYTVTAGALLGEAKTAYFPVKKGQYDTPESATDEYHFSIRSVSFGDVNTDGKEDALVVADLSYGGNGLDTIAQVYSINAKGELVALLQVSPDYDNAALDTSGLWLSRSVWAENDPRCCPSKTVKEQWSWNGTKWVKLQSLTVKNKK
jgi:hypothetical protein